jgi:hypothetical protein
VDIWVEILNPATSSFAESATMNKILEKNLLKKYPVILKNMYGPMDKTCMHFGIECGDGWYYLIDNLCASIQHHINLNKKHPVVADQIKEKWGTLCFYYTGGDELVAGMVAFAEFLSASICENCGSMHQYVGRVEKGWVQTLCLKCSVEYNRPLKLGKDAQMWTKVSMSRTNPNRAWKGVDELTKKDFTLSKKRKKK